jgi:GT2 family glycosyltransferase
VIQQKDVFISALRNSGVRQSLGEVVAFLDADCITDSDLLDRALQLLEWSGEKVIVGGDYRVPPDSSWVARAWYEHRVPAKRGSVPYLPSGNLFVRRQEFLALGGFDESIQTNEDSELCSRARARGFRIIATPLIAVVHLGTPQSLGGFFRKQRWHGAHVARIFLRSRGRQNLKPVGLAVYTIVAGLVVLGAVLARLWLLSAAAGLFLFLPSLLLCLRSGLRSRKVRWVLPLAVMTFVYGVARAACILNPRVLRQR